MENTKLKLTVQNLHEENEELESEIRQLRESCNRLCLTLLNNRKITMQEISNLLPQKEVDFIKQEREKQLKHQ